MKNLILTLAFTLIGTFAFASNEVVVVNNEDSTTSTTESLSECCTVTVSGGDGDATVTKCRTTRKDACDAAYQAAFAASE